MLNRLEHERARALLEPRPKGLAVLGFGPDFTLDEGLSARKVGGCRAEGVKNAVRTKRGAGKRTLERDELLKVAVVLKSAARGSGRHLGGGRSLLSTKKRHCVGINWTLDGSEALES